jgi:hypothetical protein
MELIQWVDLGVQRISPVTMLVARERSKNWKWATAPEQEEEEPPPPPPPRQKTLEELEQEQIDRTKKA